MLLLKTMRLAKNFKGNALWAREVAQQLRVCTSYSCRAFTGWLTTQALGGTRDLWHLQVTCTHIYIILTTSKVLLCICITHFIIDHLKPFRGKIVWELEMWLGWQSICLAFGGPGLQPQLCIKPGMVMYVCLKLQNWRRSEVQGCLLLYGEFEANVGCMTPCLKVKNEQSCPFLSGLQGPHWLVFPLGSVVYQKASRVCSLQMILFYKKQYLKESFVSLVGKRHVSHSSASSLIPASFQAIAPMCHSSKSFSTWVRSNIYEKQLEISEFQMCGTKNDSVFLLGF